MVKWMPKLRRLGKRKIPQISSDKSLKKIFGNAKPKFYTGKAAQVLAVASLPNEGLSSKTATIALFNPKKKRFEPFATALLSKESSLGVEISSASKLPEKYRSVEMVPGKVIRFYARQKTGFNLFRLFLNEAIAFAKENKCGIVTIFAQNNALEEYYTTLGFEFEVAGRGVFRVKRQKRPQK